MQHRVDTRTGVELARRLASSYSNGATLTIFVARDLWYSISFEQKLWCKAMPGVAQKGIYVAPRLFASALLQLRL